MRASFIAVEKLIYCITPALLVFFIILRF